MTFSVIKGSDTLLRPPGFSDPEFFFFSYKIRRLVRLIFLRVGKTTGMYNIDIKGDEPFQK